MVLGWHLVANMCSSIQEFPLTWSNSGTVVFGIFYYAPIQIKYKIEVSFQNVLPFYDSK